MEPPIILAENGDLSIFETVVAAEDHAEPIDVRNQEYVAYDCTGRRLALQVVYDARRGYERVEISDQDGRAATPDELSVLLRQHLAALGFEARDVDRKSLEDLVHLVSNVRKGRR